MSTMTTGDGSPAVSSDAFLTALTSGAAPAEEPATPTSQPAPADAAAPDAPATALSREQRDASSSETTPEQPPDEVTTLKARLAKLEEDGQRRESTYSANVRQQREALEQAQRAAVEAHQRAQQLEANQAKAAEQQWQAQVAGWQQQVAQADPSQQQYLNTLLSAAIREHDAEQKVAQVAAREAQLAPVVQQLTGLGQQVEMQQYVSFGVNALQTAGADNLAAEVGVPVDEVRAYLNRPQVVQRIQRALALTHIARARGEPVPTIFEDVGEQIRDHFAELAQARAAAEERVIARNQESLVNSGATRGDGGGAAGGGRREIKTMSDVTTADWLRALRG